MDIENRLKECTTSFDDFLLELLADPETAKYYLETSLETYKADNNIEILAQSMRNVIAAHGGFAKFAEHTRTNSEQLYNMLNGKQLLPLNNLRTIISDLQDYCVAQD